MKGNQEDVAVYGETVEYVSVKGCLPLQLRIHGRNPLDFIFITPHPEKATRG